MISALPVLLAACQADLIRHDAGGVLGDSGVTSTDAQTADAAALDAAIKDTSVPDAGRQDVGLHDTGTPDSGLLGCDLRATSAEVIFERTEVGRTSTTSILLTNLDFDDCEVRTSVRPAGGGFLTSNPLVVVLPPGGSEQVDLSFSPSAAGFFEAELVATIGGGAPLVVRLAGEGFLAEVASTREAIIVVRNAAGRDRYLVLEGRDCLGLAPNVPQALSFQCGCECPPPPPPGPTRLVRIPPGATHSVRWSTRRLHTWEVPIECGPDHTVIETRGALAPVPDGTYPVRLAFERNLPSFCTATGDPDVFDCDPIGGNGDLPPVIAPLCETDGFVQTLVMVGPNDVTVPVDITD